MSKKTARAVISGVVVMSALVLLLVVTVSEGAAYYKHVDEVMGNPSPWYGKAMQLHGFVVDDSIQKRPNSLDYRFKIKYGEATVDARYTGIVPDTFKDASEVVLKGRLTPSGFEVEPDGVMAKCPSRYEAAGPKK